MIRYLPEKSIENPGLVSATLGLSFQIDESHFAPRARLASDGSTLMRSQEKELWALCEATMPPIEGTTFPFTREVYLGSLSQTFDHFQSDANGLLCKFIFSSLIKVDLWSFFSWPNSPGPLSDDWKVTDDSFVNFHDVFFFIFCQIIAKNEEKHIMKIYG